jgi:hypothetical protein
MLQTLRQVAAGRADKDADTPNPAKERALLARAQRLAVKQSMAVKAGELVDARKITGRLPCARTRVHAEDSRTECGRFHKPRDRTCALMWQASDALPHSSGLRL